MELNKANGSLEEALERLLSISWHKDSSDGEVDADLVGEYIRRVAILTEKFQLKLTNPFFSPIAVISISGELSAVAMRKFLSEVGDSALLENAYVRRVCECYLQWCEGVDSGVEVAATIPDLFDPMIALLERGGSFGLHHGEVLVGNGAIPLKNWRAFTSAVPMYPMSFEKLG